MVYFKLKKNLGFYGFFLNITAFKPSRCIKASFYIPENRLNFPTTRAFSMKIPMQVVYMQVVKPHQVIFRHYKSRTVTAIWGL